MHTKHPEVITLLCRADAFSSNLSLLVKECQALVSDLERTLIRLACEATLDEPPSVWTTLGKLKQWAFDLLLPSFIIPPSTFDLLEPEMPQLEIPSGLRPDLVMFFDLMNRKLQAQASIIRQLEEGSYDRDRLIAQLERRLIDQSARRQQCLSVDSILSSYVSSTDCPTHKGSNAKK
eukprot:Blabericola_migrator_1__3738@NODE_211_length_11365_cov_144_425828_g181_i0_p8_GENE_NODE_211_length_11365_cov_144_425828_g181_i0NODE_211_length_11365_cov_144_425828_g181_i0_p8_ORF_typecomplete_len177_score42_10_NODE_211_length_11365_cov_144_425828_g181_i062256755